MFDDCATNEQGLTDNKRLDLLMIFISARFLYVSDGKTSQDEITELISLKANLKINI